MTSSMLSVFKGYDSAPPSPDELGFEQLDVEPLTEEDIVKHYLDYKETGGEPIDVWEARLTRLRKAGRLAAIVASYESKGLTGSVEDPEQL